MRCDARRNNDSEARLEGHSICNAAPRSNESCRPKRLLFEVLSSMRPGQEPMDLLALGPFPNQNEQNIPWTMVCDQCYQILLFPLNKYDTLCGSSSIQNEQ